MTQQRPDQNGSSNAEARESCFRQLAEQPANLSVRLRLARLFYEDGLHEFAVRELIEIRRRAEVMPPSLERLLSAFGEIARPYLEAATAGSSSTTEQNANDPSAADTVAELDVDADFADLLVDLEEGTVPSVPNCRRR